MTRFFKFFEYAYLIFAGLFIYETIRIWPTERNRAYLFIFFTVVALGMFFFKKHFRKKYEKNKQD
ncbi:hypothetical protein ACH3O9_03940 [Leeuwenhoekiella sp. A16]|uniref:hypothetical protein n=1 Tax=unclassified Leeuwenhoekiella TaxID=2615029 RepID=UPI003A8012BD|tara:strand:+ start:61 stop:255 length:195 start_codon:yes stop_codon:yes gene_type:complete